MSRPVRIAVDLWPQHADYDTIRSAVVEAEEMGVDIAFNWDHFFPLSGGSDGKHFECWTMLASWAEITERIEIGPLVSATAYRNPDLIADMARTVDHISDGRFILGLGAGWNRRDHDEYGYVFGTPGSRLALLESGLRRIETRMARLNPPPRRPIPILVGGGGEKKTLRYTARHADIWHGSGSPDVIRRKSAILDEWCHHEGRDPAAIERAAGADPRAPEIGDAYLDAGATLITLAFDGRAGYDLRPVGEWLAWRDQRNRG